MLRKLLCLIFLLPFAVLSQTLETKNYSWQEKPVLYKLEAAENAEPSVVILDKRYLEFIYNKDNDLEEYFTRHLIVHINDNREVESFNRIYIPVNSPTQLITFKARSIRDGQVKEMLLGEMKEVVEKGQRYMSLAVDGLEKNSELEYYYTMQFNVGYFRSEIFATNTYTRKFEYSIISPENLVIESRSYNGFPQLKDTLLDRKRFLSGEYANIPPVLDEKYASTDANRLRVESKLAKNLANGSGRILTWADAGNEYYNRLCKYDKSELKEIDKIASKLQLKKKNELEAVFAIENYIKTTYEISDEVNQSNITDIVKNNYASSMSACRLAAALMKNAGVKYEIVVTINRFVKRFDADFDSWNYLDDVLFYLPTLDRFMMPSNYLYRAGLPPFPYLDNSALYIKEIMLGDVPSALSSVKKLPPRDTTDSHDNLDIRIKFSPDMKKVTQEVVHSFNGYPAIAIRPYYFYASEEDRKVFIEDVFKSGIEDAQVSNTVIRNFNINSDEVEKPFIISANLNYSSLLEKAGNTYLYNVGMVIGPQTELYHEKPRQQPIDVNYLHSYNRTITIEIPEGYVVKGLEDLNKNITGEDGAKPTLGFISSYTMKGNSLEIKVLEYYDKLTYPASFYTHYIKVINAAADFNKIKIILEKKS